MGAMVTRQASANLILGFGSSRHWAVVCTVQQDHLYSAIQHHYAIFTVHRTLCSDARNIAMHCKCSWMHRSVQKCCAALLQSNFSHLTKKQSNLSSISISSNCTYTKKLKKIFFSVKSAGSGKGKDGWKRGEEGREVEEGCRKRFRSQLERWVLNSSQYTPIKRFPSVPL